MRETPRDQKNASARVAEKVVGGFLVLGIFLVLQTFFLGQKDLVKPLAPLHLALLGALGAFLFGALGSRTNRLSLLGIAAASGLLSLGFSLLDRGGWVLGAGWPALIAWSFAAASRGGP